MSGAGTGYDLSTAIFNPEGKIFQLEYAGKATDQTSTVVGMVCADGLLIGAEKQIVSRMMVANTNRRIMAVHKNASIVFTGLIPDARNIVSRARQEASSYMSSYGKQIPSRILAERIAMYVHAFTLGGTRPFGVQTILASADTDGSFHLYMIDPAGQFFEYYACTAGKGRQICKTELDKLDLANLTVRDSVYQMAKMLHKTHEESRDRQFELDMTWICADSGFEAQFVPPEFLKETEAQALADIEAEEMGD